MKKVSLAKRIISALNQIVKKKHIILFNSFPPASDNALALYQYIIKNRKDIVEKYRIIWAQDDKVRPKSIKGEYVRKKSLKGLLLFLQSEYVISTHSYFFDVRSGKGQKLINLWHGCGYKGSSDGEKGYQGDATIVVGDVYKKINAEVLCIPEKHVFVTGYPRNDWLFSSTDALKKIGIDRDITKKVYMWMPTYRKGAIGYTGLDGDEKSFGVYTLSESQLNEINSKLVEKKAVLIVKPHPMDSASVEKIKGYSNIKLVENSFFQKNNIKLYELLGRVDCLLSDYSSVVVDYLILNRPIIMVLSDLEEYKQSRGFVFDQVENYFPGPIINDFGELIQYFDHAETIDKKWSQKRSELRSMFHKYLDNRSCERVCAMIWGKNARRPHSAKP